ncbi:MAG: hypothetical protein ACTS2F_29850 [Thainema sp.]
MASYKEFKPICALKFKQSYVELIYLRITISSDMRNYRLLRRVIFVVVGTLLFELYTGEPARAQQDFYIGFAQVPTSNPGISSEDDETSPLEDMESGTLQDSSLNETLPSETEIVSTDVLEMKRWDVLTTFIVTLPAIISALTGLVATIQVRKFLSNTEGEESNGQIQWQLLIAVGFVIAQPSSQSDC